MTNPRCPICLTEIPAGKTLCPMDSDYSRQVHFAAEEGALCEGMEDEDNWFDYDGREV